MAGSWTRHDSKRELIAFICAPRTDAARGPRPAAGGPGALRTAAGERLGGARGEARRSDRSEADVPAQPDARPPGAAEARQAARRGHQRQRRAARRDRRTARTASPSPPSKGSRFPMAGRSTASAPASTGTATTTGASPARTPPARGRRTLRLDLEPDLLRRRPRALSRQLRQRRADGRSLRGRARRLARRRARTSRPRAGRPPVRGLDSLGVSSNGSSPSAPSTAPRPVSATRERVSVRSRSVSARQPPPQDEDVLAELKELLRTAGVATAGEMIQVRPAPDPDRYFGRGKLEELKAEIKRSGANVVACDDELAAAPGAQPRGGARRPRDRPHGDHPRHLRRPRALGRGQAAG